MSRPDYPNCVMPVSVIHGVQERQRAYDADPEGYERREREAEEQRRQEEQAEWEFYREQHE